MADMLEKCSFNLPSVYDLKDGDPFLEQCFQDIVICIQSRWISGTFDIYATVLMLQYILLV